MSGRRRGRKPTPSGQPSPGSKRPWTRSRSASSTLLQQEDATLHQQEDFTLPPQMHQAHSSTGDKIDSFMLEMRTFMTGLMGALRPQPTLTSSAAPSALGAPPPNAQRTDVKDNLPYISPGRYPPVNNGLLFILFGRYIALSHTYSSDRYTLYRPNFRTLRKKH